MPLGTPAGWRPVWARPGIASPAARLPPLTNALRKLAKQEVAIAPHLMDDLPEPDQKLAAR
jgi:hypothetical protein